jgi:hypothetical protein
MRKILLLVLVVGASFLIMPPAKLSTVRAMSPATAITVSAVLQQYESGFMIWRSDTGLIWVFGYNGAVYPYGSTMYGALPENPVRTATPAQRFRPRLGFGKVWGNFPAARAVLGWPTALEEGYILTINYTTIDTTYQINLPNNRVITVYDSNHWQDHGLVEPQTVYAAFQAFDYGYMIWVSDTQEVWVFFGKDRGSLQGYALGTYAYLPDNPITENPPPGHVKPINAFGRIWGHDVQLRQRIGWPIASEQGYIATTQVLDNGQFNLSIPDRRIFKIYGTAWNF